MTTFSHLLAQHCHQTPDRMALVLQHAGQPDTVLSYRDLMRGAHGFARTYADAGLQPGEVVVLILQHGADLVYAFWGAVLHGAIPSIMPFLTEKLSPERYRADLAALVEITRPSAIVTYPEFAPEVRAALRTGSSVRAVLVTDAIQPPSEPDFSTLPGLRRAAEDIVLLQHSSGTTGLQKGVALSHRAVLNQLDAYGAAIALNPAHDVIVSWLPLYHDMGLIASFILPILRGVPLVLMSPFDWVRAPQRLLLAVSQYRGTLSWLPNFAFNFCAQKIRERHLEGVDLSSWRAVINCSEPVRWESHHMFIEKFKPFGLNPLAPQTSYAMAENVFGVTQSALDRAPAVDEIDRESFMTERVARPKTEGRPAIRMMSSGRPIANTRIRILDEKGRDLPERVVGEIALQSDCMLTGYYNRPDATATALVDGWYLTGDYGYVADGELYVSGRKKDMIIVGGKNVYPQDIESLASEVPGVHPGRVVAFGLFDEETGTEDVVVVAEVDDESPDAHQKLADAIRKHVTQNSAIALRYVRVVGPRWILKTSSGKTARAANKEKFLRELRAPERSTL
ncbi:MAG: AMP-binding protein [Anaerolineales bacterium]